MKWLPIATAPRHGNYVRVYAEEGVLFCPDDGEPTHWLPLPAAPGGPPLITEAMMNAGIRALGSDDDRSSADKILDIWTTMRAAEGE